MSNQVDSAVHNSYLAWRDEGYVGVMEHYWVSNIEQSDVTLAAALIESLDFEVAAFVREEGQGYTHKATAFSTIFKDHFALSFAQFNQKIAGRYLMICFPYKTTDRAALHGHLEKLITALRLHFGREVALREVFQCEYNLSEMKRESATTAEGVGQVSWEERLSSWHYLSGHQAFGSQFSGHAFSNAAAKLVHAAFNTEDHDLRFILLWCALEAQIGDGKARKNFCFEQCRSEKLSTFLSHMHKIRNSFVHGDERRLDVLPCHPTLLFALLRLSAIKERSIVNKLVEAFETALDSINGTSQSFPLVEPNTAVHFHVSDLAPEEAKP